mgnify:CR=1 FL=1|jgi:Protein of unknown function (DUF664).
MDAIAAIRLNMQTAEMIGLGYLNDLTDEEMMLRPAPGCNHLNWQLGHLVVSEHEMLQAVNAAELPALPEGLEKAYSKETAGSDNPADFWKKDQLLEAYQNLRAASQKLLDQQTPESLEKPTGIDYAPTVGAIFMMLGSHWLMHCGQWAVVRRQTGRPPLF